MNGVLLLEGRAMGILVDYFVASPPELTRLNLKYGPAPADWPHVDCKGWLDGLDSLAAELTGRDLSEFGDDERVLGDEEEEAGLTRVAREVVAALAGVDDARLRSYADDELLDDWEVARYTALRDLARSAVSSDRDVYCWWSL
jgi:hypothetical protein